MLAGFEKQTTPLTEIELRLIPGFIKGLSTKLGPSNAISASEIVDSLLASKNPVKISQVQVRKIINYISIRRMLPGLVANGQGYYITHSEHELKRYHDSLIGRRNQIQERIDAVAEHLKEIVTLKQSSLNL